jgi:dTDP-4-amino-4,6-dideoxygalactose transaminase
MKYLDLPQQWEPLIPKILEEMEADMKIGRFVGGPRIERLEEALCEFTGFSHCICVSTGTMALEAACSLLGTRLDSVWGIPDLTFQATAFAALRGGLDVEVLKAKNPFLACLQEPRYDKPTIPVDLYGTPTNWEAPTLYPLLVDGCQSLGARVNAKHVGETNVWAYAVSFYPGKNLGSMGEGGALLTNDEYLAEFARAYINQGQKTKGKHEQIGTNGRMHALQAIPIYYGLNRLGVWNDQRRRVARRYDKQIQEINEIHPICEIPMIPEGRTPTRHVYPVFSRDHDLLKKALTEAKIPFGQHYPEQLSQSTCFKNYRHFDATKAGPPWPFRREISLPIHPFMTERDVTEVCNALRPLAEKMAKEPKYDCS